MINSVDLVKSNLIRYFYAVSKREKAELDLLALDTSMGAKSPKFDNSPVGYSGTKDEKLVNYSIKKQKLDDEIKSWYNESQVYFNILHLFELEDKDIEFLSYIYKDKLSGDEIAKKLFYSDRKYVSRKHNALLEKLSKYV